MSTTTHRLNSQFRIFCVVVSLFCLCLVTASPILAQDMNKKTGLIRGGTYTKDKNNKRNFGSLGGDNAAGGGSTPWSFGIKGGINTTAAKPNQSFDVFSYTIEPANAQEGKVYNGQFENKGIHVAFIAKYAVMGGFSVGIQPTFASYSYSYENTFTWLDFESPTNSLFLTYNHEQTLNYIELPLILRYDVAFGSLKPFVQGGGYYGRLLNALKKVNVTGQDFASGANEEFESTSSTFGITDQYLKSQYGIIAGGGIGFIMGPATIELSVDYRIAMNKSVDDNQRFSDNMLISGTYDVLDNVAIKNMAFSLGLLFGI